MPQLPCRVLCIDDHEDTSQMLQVILAHESYKVDTAITIKEALRLAEQEKFDLYVLDRHLPDGSGLELCRKLTQITPGVPCIFYSGDAYELHKSEAMAAGADHYVVKPDIDGLIEAVHQHLSARACAPTS